MTPEPLEMEQDQLPPFTFLVEWENAQDVEMMWTERAMCGLAEEIRRNHGAFGRKPKLMYLYDRGKVNEGDIRACIQRIAPELETLTELEFVPTPGLTYYRLKNEGARRATTPFIVMVDSDAAPQPGWLMGLMRPFADPEIQGVAGFTTLGHKDVLSRMMALCWIFDLPSERARTGNRRTVHANNCAFRTDFFRANPWPEVKGSFKKACGFWAREMDRRGVNWVRTAEAVTIHAPQPGHRFLVWRAWIGGKDRDYHGAFRKGFSRWRRARFAFKFWRRKMFRSTCRILTKGHEVDLKPWQMPLALLYAWSYYSVCFVSQMFSALTRTYEGVPENASPASPKA
jgi:hypothetical protein